MEAFIYSVQSSFFAASIAALNCVATSGGCSASLSKYAIACVLSAFDLFFVSLSDALPLYCPIWLMKAPAAVLRFCVLPGVSISFAERTSKSTPGVSALSGGFCAQLFRRLKHLGACGLQANRRGRRASLEGFEK